MRIVRFLIALISMAALSSYLASVSMCLVALVATPQALSAHSPFDIAIKVFFSVPTMGVAIAAPICSLLAIVFAVAIALADRLKVLTSQRARVIASSIVCALPGLAFGRMAGTSACQIGLPAQHLNCDLGMWVGVLAFAASGALAGMTFAIIDKQK